MTVISELLQSNNKQQIQDYIYRLFSYAPNYVHMKKSKIKHPIKLIQTNMYTMIGASCAYIQIKFRLNSNSN